MLLEDAIDVHDRHWKIHWMINFAQFSATIALGATIAEVKGEVDPGLPGRLQSSSENRNWDSIEALWQMKEEVKGEPELQAAFGNDTAARHHGRARGLRRGRAIHPGARRSVPLRVRAQVDLVARVHLPDLVRAARADPPGCARLHRVRLRLSGRARARQGGSRRSRAPSSWTASRRARAATGFRPRSTPRSGSTRSRPTTTSSSTRAPTRGCGSCSSRSAASWPREGALDDPEDVFFLKYNELRMLIGGGLEGARDSSRDRRDEREDAFELRPPTGSAPPPPISWRSRTSRCGASRRSSTARAAPPPIRSSAWGRRPAWPRAGRVVSSLDQFNEVRTARSWSAA